MISLITNCNGERVRRRDFRDRCEHCFFSRRPGYIWIFGDNWLECPLCNTQGYFSGVETITEPTRRIFLPGRF